MGPRLAILSGGPRGSSAGDQGDLELVSAQVHGIVDFVRDGVLLCVPWR